MIIDFHTHIWPDKLAAKTVNYLEKKGNIPSYLDGTVDNLKKSMKEAGVDYSVILPVVTKPEQFETVNGYSVELNQQKGLIAMGGIHPNCKGIKEKIRQLKSMGLKGIKIHPDYQETYIDDPKYITVIEEALAQDLIVVTHAGLDVAYPNQVRCTPDRVVTLLKHLGIANQTSQSKLVLAHTGGYAMWDEVETYLVGQPIYLDLSITLGSIQPSQLQRIIRTHGSNRILFATDSPWASQKEMITVFNKLPLSPEEKDEILYKNARQLLDL